MLALERKSKIKETILEKKSVVVTELAEAFGVTEETIRRDLKALEDEGVLTRTYGGAFVQNGVLNDINITLREGILVENKEKIAELCRRRVNNGDSVFVDPSTTGLCVVRALLGMRLTVLTNALKVMDTLATRDDMDLVGIGGRFSPKHMAFLGQAAADALKDYYIDKAFVSCRSLSMEQGVTDASEGLAQLRREVIEHANEVYLIADHSKFNKASFLRICGFDKITCLVTDEPLSGQWATFCADNNVQILTP